MIQVEYSPFTLDIESESIGLLKAARELGIKIVAYAPLGRGLITGRYVRRFLLSVGSAARSFIQRNLPMTSMTATSARVLRGTRRTTSPTFSSLQMVLRRLARSITPPPGRLPWRGFWPKGKILSPSLVLRNSQYVRYRDRIAYDIR